jgi:hypothetical protein
MDVLRDVGGDHVLLLLGEHGSLFRSLDLILLLGLKKNEVCTIKYHSKIKLYIISRNKWYNTRRECEEILLRVRGWQYIYF